jgi:hypothetical protein
MCKELCLGAALLITGCVDQLYDWGTYEVSVAHLCSPQRNQSIDTDRQVLAEEIEASEKAGKRVPPGKYAHVGYLAYLAGDKPAAALYFEREKQAFPESAPMMDQFLRRLQ